MGPTHTNPSWNCTLTAPTCTINLNGLLTIYPTLQQYSKPHLQLLLQYSGYPLSIPITGDPISLAEPSFDGIAYQEGPPMLTVWGTGEMINMDTYSHHVTFHITDRRPDFPAVNYSLTCTRGTPPSGSDFIFQCPIDDTTKTLVYRGPFEWFMQVWQDGQQTTLLKTFNKSGLFFPDPQVISLQIVTQPFLNYLIQGTGFHTGLSVSIGSISVAPTLLPTTIRFAAPVYPFFIGGGYAVNVVHPPTNFKASLPFSIEGTYINQPAPVLDSWTTTTLSTNSCTVSHYSPLYRFAVPS